MWMSFSPQNAKCKMHLVSARCGPNQTRHEINIEKQKTLQDWLENSACNWDGASGQFCIEHITCPANLTKFSLKMHFPSLLPDCAPSWALWFNQIDCALIWALSLCSYLSTFQYSIFNVQFIFCLQFQFDCALIWALSLYSYLSTLKKSFKQPGPIWALGKAASD